MRWDMPFLPILCHQQTDRSVGARERLRGAQTPSQPLFQPKLIINQPGDIYEQELTAWRSGHAQGRTDDHASSRGRGRGTGPAQGTKRYQPGCCACFGLCSVGPVRPAARSRARTYMESHFGQDLVMCGAYRPTGITVGGRGKCTGIYGRTRCGVRHRTVCARYARGQQLMAHELAHVVQQAKDTKQQKSYSAT